MSAANARSNTFNETFLNDTYQDASTVSMELDKGNEFLVKYFNQIFNLHFTYSCSYRVEINKYWRTMRSNRSIPEAL